jgi:hypothetical protein
VRLWSVSGDEAAVEEKCLHRNSAKRCSMLRIVWLTLNGVDFSTNLSTHVLKTLQDRNIGNGIRHGSCLPAEAETLTGRRAMVECPADPANE